MKTIVPSFGLFEAGGLTFLLQQDGQTQTAVPWDHPGPFETNLRKCPHAIDLSLEPDPEDWDIFENLLSDPLILEMLPIRKRVRSPAYFGLAPDDEDQVCAWASELEKMSAPTQGRGGLPLWLANPRTIAGELATSNICPVVLTRADPRHTRTLMDVGMVPGSRPLVALGSNAIAIPPVYRRLRTSLGSREMVEIDWAAVGARVCREHMLGRNFGWPTHT